MEGHWLDRPKNEENNFGENSSKDIINKQNYAFLGGTIYLIGGCWFGVGGVCAHAHVHTHVYVYVLCMYVYVCASLSVCLSKP